MSSRKLRSYPRPNFIITRPEVLHSINIMDATERQLVTERVASGDISNTQDYPPSLQVTEDAKHPSYKATLNNNANCQEISDKAISSCELLKDIIESNDDILNSTTTETMRDLVSLINSTKTQISSYLTDISYQDEKNMDILIKANDQIVETLLLYSSFEHALMLEKSKEEKYKSRNGSSLVISDNLNFNIQSSSKNNSSNESLNFQTPIPKSESTNLFFDSQFVGTSSSLINSRRSTPPVFLNGNAGKQRDTSGMNVNFNLDNH
ncbi:hypothetical protein AYI69_g11226 [Smittium culicis]|uniref:GAT domain-containing protein n=1 Tax=Smittium culicis TaxID=133412 RepID=A0A1R1X069_9FUNG|nr:hypothetical protein AYI69_g11226 [Smittium culicis]